MKIKLKLYWYNTVRTIETFVCGQKSCKDKDLSKRVESKIVESKIRLRCYYKID